MPYGFVPCEQILRQMPTDHWLPQDGLKADARGGRRYHVVADPLNVHFRAGKEGVWTYQFKAVSF